MMTVEMNASENMDRPGNPTGIIQTFYVEASVMPLFST